MVFFLLFLLMVCCYGNKRISHTYTLINACNGIISDELLKETMANVYKDYIYTPNVEGWVTIYQGTEQLLTNTSSLQYDVIVDAINGVNSSATCDWEAIFSMPLPSANYLVMFIDDKYCGNEPYHAVSMCHSAMHQVVYPVAMGDQVDMMEIYHIAGPCVRPGCFNVRDYLRIHS